MLVENLPPPGIPDWLKRFDWLVGWSHGWANPDIRPHSVMLHASVTKAFSIWLKKKWGDLPGADSSFLVIGGDDTHLSAQEPEVLDRLLSTFPGGVFYEAFDNPYESIDIMPIGLQEFYLRGYEDHLMSLIKESGSGRLAKVLASWGHWWPQLDESIDDRHRARVFATTSNLVDTHSGDPLLYFGSLARYEFMLCPMGNGIQTPKLFEALMMGCIPILTKYPASIRLKARGFPIALVDDWREINESTLGRFSDELKSAVIDFQPKLRIEPYWNLSFVEPFRKVS